jgi:hypothetical protein
MPEINLNRQFAEILTQHHVSISVGDEFIYTDLPSKTKFNARSIIECFGDFGHNIETAIQNNFINFASSSLHVLLLAFGKEDAEIANQIDIEEWRIGDKTWTVYLGNLIPETNNKNPDIRPPAQFFNAIKTGIYAQNLKDELHWF